MRNFLTDRRGNYSMLFAIALLPIMGGLALAVDYREMSSQKQATLNALDAAGIATARYIVSGASDAQVIAYARRFFEANLGGAVDPADTTFKIVLPSNQAGGGTLKLSAKLNYRPYFYGAFSDLANGGEGGATEELSIGASTELRLKNTLEVALVLDNSGSMNDPGFGSGQKRIDLLKTAAKQLVDTLALQASLIKQVEKPVQFSLVPFAASVNVGAEHGGAVWMDYEGLSPIHHENFDWSTLNDANKGAEKRNGVWYKKGSGWGSAEGQMLTRFALYRDMRVVTSHERVAGSERVVCDEFYSNNTCKRSHKEYDYIDTYGPFASWQGCVEARPYPYNVNDAPPQGGTQNTGIGNGDPATMFVPMFAPDEPGNHWKVTQDPDEPDPKTYNVVNSWWNDDPTSSTGKTRQKNMKKYFMPRPIDAKPLAAGAGPNYSCSTTPITPLVDVSTEAGLAQIKTAIDKMGPNGATNVPEGMAWGWRTISSSEPFTGGRPESERGNDKVVIVLTDGANTYYTPGWFNKNDPADNKSSYAAYGYMKPGYNGTGTARMFMGTSSSIGQYNYSETNYSNALNEQLATLCTNAKDAKVMVMTVALDLDPNKTADAAQIAGLKKCSSDSRFRKDPTDASKPAKLFWNATGSNLSEKFKEIADELSNLRIVG
jgi:Flp pilus assembly protein TadG